MFMHLFNAACIELKVHAFILTFLENQTHDFGVASTVFKLQEYFFNRLKACFE